MAQVLTKGVLLKATIATVLTTVAQLLAIDPPGWKSLSYDSSTFDQVGVGKSKDMNGWAESSEFGATLFWDPSLASHIAVLGFITTPVKVPWEVLFISGKKIDFVVADLEMKPKVEKENALMCELKGGIDGLPVVT